ncbi:MAG: GAF domain-containing protein [Deltaproteobacteria bacterium]|nr:GAF domain-containing protein [Deltaproteobacteria bacterium]
MASIRAPAAADPRDRKIAELKLQLERERKANAALRDVALALGSPLDVDTLLELVLAKTAELLEAERATAYLIDDASGNLVSRIVVGGKVQAIRLEVGEGIAGSVVKSGKPIRVKDAYRDKRFDRSWDAQTGYKTRSIVAVPMKNHLGRTIGVLQVLNKDSGGEFSADDESLLNSLATQAAISIDNAKLFMSVVQKNVQLRETQELLERKVDEFKLLFDLESAMARAATEQELASAVLTETVRATRVTAGALLVVSAQDEGNTLYWVKAGQSELGVRSKMTPAAGSAIAKAMNDGPQLVQPAAGGAAHPLPDGRDLGFEVASVVAVPLTTEDGSSIGALALYDRTNGRELAGDDTELAKLVAVNATTAISLLRARQSREMTERLSTIGRLLSSVLHDLKTPMTVIAGYVQLLSMTEDLKLRAEYSELVLKQFDHITAMQREVLAFARGERTLFVSRVYLSKYFEEMRAQIEHELKDRPVKLQMVIGDRGIARFDEGKITRAIHNLVRNSLEAMGEGGGTLGIEVQRDGTDLVISVSDTGPGIPTEIEGSLFQSFVTKKAGGTGLGLAIVKKVVEEHGGTVRASSSESGAVFTVRLPQPA